MSPSRHSSMWRRTQMNTSHRNPRSKRYRSHSRNQCRRYSTYSGTSRIAILGCLRLWPPRLQRLLPAIARQQGELPGPPMQSQMQKRKRETFLLLQKPDSGHQRVEVSISQRECSVIRIAARKASAVAATSARRPRPTEARWHGTQLLTGCELPGQLMISVVLQKTPRTLCRRLG